MDQMQKWTSSLDHCHQSYTPTCNMEGAATEMERSRSGITQNIIINCPKTEMQQRSEELIVRSDRG